MRRIMMCLVASLITFGGASAFAQEVRPSSDSGSTGVQLGVVGLLNFSTLSYSADNDDAADALNDLAEYKLGFGGGLRAIIEFSPYLGIQPEILFKQYGTKMSLEEGPVSVESSTTMNYLQVPILARIAVPLDGPVTPKLLVGPTIGYFLSGTMDAGDNSEDIDGDNVEKLDIGIAAGVGADIAAGPGSLNLDLRYDRSFTQSNKEQEGDGGAKVMNTGFSFLVGYTYKL